MTGSIPSTIELLIYLEDLYVLGWETSFYLSGAIIVLIICGRDLSENELTGPIPAEMGQLTNLRYMYAFWVTMIGHNDN